MNCTPQFRTATPRVTRLELTELYVGGDTVAVQLDGFPCDAWGHALRDVLSQDPSLAAVTAAIDGCWVHFTGVRTCTGPLAPQLLGLVRAAGELAYTPRILRPAQGELQRPGHALAPC
jgi:hypothetical protein